MLALPWGPFVCCLSPAPLTGIKRPLSYPPVRPSSACPCSIPLPRGFQLAASCGLSNGGLGRDCRAGSQEGPYSWKQKEALLFLGVAPEQLLSLPQPQSLCSFPVLVQFSDSVISASWFPQPLSRSCSLRRCLCDVSVLSSRFSSPLWLPPGFQHFLLVSLWSHGVSGFFASGTWPVRPGL